MYILLVFLPVFDATPLQKAVPLVLAVKQIFADP